MSVERHYFPGNNTPLGFFSYYKYILGQREANKIICIKGGPGTGKSTFMKKIAKRFTNIGEDVDYLHCSADESSVDGVVLKNKKIALIDATSPHTMDPVTPGAVDRIINLGEFWNEDGILASKDEIIDLSEECSRWYRIAYNYLNAAKSVFRSLEEVYNRAVESSEIYRIVADIVAREYSQYNISIRPGRVKKFFASAITGNGIINYLPTLFENMSRVYVINVPVGYGNSSFMDILKEGAVYRGFDLETFYCPMSPEEKIEHMIIPQRKLAFVTVNAYHDIEPWEIVNLGDGEEITGPEIILIDVSDYMDTYVIERNLDLINSLNEEYEILLNKTIKYLAKARDTHLMVEGMYIPNMNFTGINKLTETIIDELVSC